MTSPPRCPHCGQHKPKDVNPWHRCSRCGKSTIARETMEMLAPSKSTEEIVSPANNYYGAACAAIIQGKYWFGVEDDGQGGLWYECSKEFYEAFKKEFLNDPN